MSLVNNLTPESKSKRRETSSSCSDDYAKRSSHETVDITNYLTQQFDCLFTEDVTRNKLMKEKLHLVLDLDHTLIHSTLVSGLSEKEKYLLEESDSRRDLCRFKKGHFNDHIIKLRPFVRKFLRKANKLFTMHVFTMASSSYAKTVLHYIDPGNVYFGDRVITRKENPYSKKTLDLLVADQRRVITVDDRTDVWPHHKRNLLQIPEYKYFRVHDGTNSNSYAEEMTDESRKNGSLADVLKILRVVHRRFEEELGLQDLRLLLTECK